MTHAKQQIKERPILFSAPMVRAILEGRKTQTRRPIKPQPPADGYTLHTVIGSTGPQSDIGKHRWLLSDDVLSSEFGDLFSCPYGQPGDRLWVRETWAEVCGSEDGVCNGLECLEHYFDYRADTGAKYPGNWPAEFSRDEVPDDIRWRPSIHMPRAASRILLEITRIRVERLQEISEEDAIAEGVLPQVWHDEEAGGQPVTGYENYLPEGYVVLPTAKESFASLIKSIYGPGFWDRNDWMWVVDFKRIEL